MYGALKNLTFFTLSWGIIAVIAKVFAHFAHFFLWW